MATEVLIAHTGQRLQVDASQVLTLDHFKAYVAHHASIPAQYIITLTPQAKPLKVQSIQSEKEIYVYDGRLAAQGSAGAPPPPRSEIPLPNEYKVSNAPDFIEDTRSIQSWQELAKSRRAWTLKVVEDCRQMAAETRGRYDEIHNMLRCLDIAVSNLESVIKGLDSKYQETKNWLRTGQADYGALTTRWEEYLSLARSIPISSAMARFMVGREVGSARGRPQRQVTLEDLIDLDTAQKAGRLAAGTLRKIHTRAADLEKSASRLFENAEHLFREFEETTARSVMSHSHDAAQLMQDIEAVAKKIDTDYQMTLEYQNSSRDAISQASKIAANHTERLLPTIGKRALEMSTMQQYATHSRNSLAAESAEFMRSISEITTLSGTVKLQLASLHQEEEHTTFDYLRLIQHVPYMYASFLAEAIKRREWLEKVRQDSSTLANEMALFQEEEIKRRKKWAKSVSNLYGPEALSSESNAPGVEVNLLGEDEQWPTVTRRDLDEFYKVLQAYKADANVVSDVAKIIAELNNPTRQQSKRMKAFKNGSVHEAALGRSGLLIRGDDELLRSLQDDKSKLESKLKTAESRVRRLEDLLHRQTQASRPSIGNLFQNQTPSQQFSDRHDSTLSVRPPRASEDRRRSVEGADALVHRVQELEANLNLEKERSAKLEKDLSAQVAQYNNTKGQMDEANSTKKDLLENMEALKREFVEERKSLEAEIKRLQLRLEDTEDEIEHFGESRENEKHSYDEKIRVLELEVERLAAEKRDESLKSEGQVEFLRKEARLQRERIETQERQLQTAQEESKAAMKRAEALEETSNAMRNALRDLWEQLLHGDLMPDDLIELSEGISGKVSDLLARLQTLERDTTILRLELDSTQNSVKSIRAEKESAETRLASLEAESTALREKLAEEKARAAALEGELSNGREQLSQLRERLSDGETGSESLRKGLEEDEEKVTFLTEELASRQSHVDSLEEEARALKKRLQETQSKSSELGAWFESRTEHAKNLTQRLYAHNERLTRLLERLGFSVTRQGSSMVIQKVPRSERSAQSQIANDTDPNPVLRRSSTSNSRVAVDSADLELLYWADSSSRQVEAERYEAFMAALGSFDIDAFSETIYRRVKDVESLARKLQRDTRSYRERAHLMQKEAHDKIAFRNFKEGDLALFLPTRNQRSGAWAAFNIGAPHYFLREQEVHRLQSREWLLARISRIQERQVDLSKTLQHRAEMGKRANGADLESPEDDNDNPFDLSDGLRWYLIEAAEDKPGAPSTPGLAKSTVAANNVEAMADMHTHGRSGSKGTGLVGRGAASSGIEGVSKTLSKSLESRRSSTGSRKALPFAMGGSRGRDSAVASETNSLKAAPSDTPTATSPTQQHAVLAQNSGQAAESLQHLNGPSSGSADVAHGKHSSPLNSEVRSEMDSLVGS
ncbi:autophagy-related protein 11 [Podospora fimiseda]|uniref:Autophagy-related protein 11 n=1 Tax=Podospora fimiseda TaxID=252190 RepID=A0AAN7BJT6_9PEZI|nr:autophagy-related protein 11 [Podospora fimiseda]